MTQETKEPISKSPSGRVTRTPVSQRNILTVKNKDPNFIYRIVNDVDDRVAQFQEAGYELVPDTAVAVGDKRVNAASSMGSHKRIGVGGGKQAVVMRIRRDWYEEDQHAKQMAVKRLEDATKENALSGTYGELKITR